MDANVKKKWIAALRSGKYKQSKHALKLRGGHCCLGVLCDLYIQETGNGKWNGNIFVSFVKDDSKIGFPSDDVLTWAGLRSYDTLVDMNDAGDSFETISNYIQKKYK